ncbi:hypothetical protein COCON_G00101330 [Conger conger]|uniref:CARD domain-containing protein n=1 Tax=Conger conger TaxID=82655 RepID=A0A9Q1HZ19_CONCO|nr:apoptosis-associated speck-like protein containing a CARD [Conger conger]KAJ8271274.1 hypothetical protein COCON_G00101330 [Conger conger]
MPKTVRERIIEALDNLSSDNLLRFKHKLSELKIIGYGLIENETTVQITRRLVSKFTTSRAIAGTAEVLRAIELHDEAEELENDRAPVAGAERPPGSATSSNTELTEGDHFVDKNQVQLIKRVTAVKSILDHLLHKKFIVSEMYSLILCEKTSEDQMRKLMHDVIFRIGEKAKDELVKILETEELYLMGDLRGN